MGASDQPFSVTSKYTAETGAELLVTVRGTTAETFRQHLEQAGDIFPRAGFQAAVGTDSPRKPDEPDGRAPISIAQARAQVAREEQGAAAHANLLAERNAQEQAARTNGHKCAKHGRASESKYFDGLYCPSMDTDTGERCKWTYRREQAPTGA